MCVFKQVWISANIAVPGTGYVVIYILDVVYKYYIIVNIYVCISIYIYDTIDTAVYVH